MTNSSKPVELISAETLALGERMRRATLGDAHVDRSLKKAKDLHLICYIFTANEAAGQGKFLASKILNQIK